MATNFVEMCTVASICALTQRIDDTWIRVSHQHIMQTTQITIDTNYVVSNQSTPDQYQYDQVFLMCPRCIQLHYNYWVD